MFTDDRNATSDKVREDVTCLMLDINRSTQMKMSLPESAWIDQQLLFVNTVNAAARELLPDTTYGKSLGDGMMIVVPDADHTGDVIQMAIAVQEEIAQLSERVDGALGTAAITVTAAITTGTGYRVDIMGNPDYWGTTIDTAARLQGAASPNAIFIDGATYEATNIRRIHAKVGVALGRKPDEYVGAAPERINLKGIPHPVEYREVLYGRQLFGVRSEFVTLNAAQENTAVAASSAPSSAKPAQLDSGRRKVGTVKYFDTARGFGFISCSDGEDFFVAPNLLMYSEDVDVLAPGRAVAFVAADANIAGKSRRAAAVLVGGVDASGTLVTAPGERPYGWIRVKQGDLTSIDVWVAAAELPGGTAVNAELDFTVEVTPKGPKAVKVENQQASQAA